MSQYGFSPVQITFAGMSWTGAMAPGVSSISAIDPSFNGDEFLTFAQGAFLRVQEAKASGRLDDIRPLVSETIWPTFRTANAKKGPAITAVEHATIYDARRDGGWDSVTVRFAAKTDDRKARDFVEDWTFQRPAVVGHQQLPDECPSCGAPLSLDDNGACKYCRVNVTGARGGWKLVRAVPPPAVQKSSSGGGRGYVIAFVVFMIFMTVVLPLGITFSIMHTTSDAFDNFGLTGNKDNSIDGPSASSKTNEDLSTPTTTRSKTRTTVSKVPTTVPLGGGLTGTADLQGAITDKVDATAVTTGAESGTCAARAAATGVTFAATGYDTGSGPQVLMITARLPAGVHGPGTYTLGSTALEVDATLADAGPSGSGTPSQTWNIGPIASTTLTLEADGSGELTFTTLSPRVPKSAGDELGDALSGTVTFSCT